MKLFRKKPKYNIKDLLTDEELESGRIDPYECIARIRNREKIGEEAEDVSAITALGTKCIAAIFKKENVDVSKMSEKEFRNKVRETYERIWWEKYQEELDKKEKKAKE